MEVIWDVLTNSPMMLILLESAHTLRSTVKEQHSTVQWFLTSVLPEAVTRKLKIPYLPWLHPKPINSEFGGTSPDSVIFTSPGDSSEAAKLRTITDTWEDTLVSITN